MPHERLYSWRPADRQRHCQSAGSGGCGWYRSPGGGVTGVVKPVSPCDNNSTLGLTLPSSQMQQVASGFHPFDSSNNVAIDSFLKDREAHEAAAINDHARKRP